MPRTLMFATVLCGLSLTTSAHSGEVIGPISIWPKAAPGEKGDVGTEHEMPAQNNDNIVRLTDVSRPTITLYRPAPEKDTGAAVVICPGGGYRILAMNLEGTEVAEWLSSIGVTGVVLKYRVPTRKDDPSHVGPLQDVQRALGLVRKRAGEWGLDPKRIGVLGFSAGGHLATNLSNNHAKRAYEPIDDADAVSCRPDFTILIYPAYLTGKSGTELSEGISVTSETPKAFLVQTQDDGVKVECAVYYYLALQNAKVPAELHVYPKGGHGYGLRPTVNEVSHWPVRAEAWMKSLGVLDRKQSTSP